MSIHLVKQLDADEYKEQRALDRAWASWHGRMKTHYWRAMWQPWMFMKPAPTPPTPLPADYDPDFVLD